MNMNDAFPSKYLKASDLQGRKATVIIARVETEEVGKQRDVRPVLYFQGKDKGMVLNKTNNTKIINAYGPMSENWTGQPITLYEAQVEFQGETVPALRVMIPPRQAAATADRVPAGTGNGHVQAPHQAPHQAPVVGGPGAGWAYHGEADDEVPFSPEMRG